MISCHGWAGGTRFFFFKGRLIEPVLGGPRFCLWLRCLSRRHGYLVPLSSAHGTRLWFDTRRSLSSGPGPDASKQLAVRDGNLMPITQPLAYLYTSVFVAFLFLWECRLLLCCCIAQLLSWLVICVSRVTCDFVSRLGGWDTNFCSKDG